MTVKQTIVSIGFLFFWGINGSALAQTSSEKESSAGIAWMTDMDAALKLAKEKDRLLLIDFMAPWCPPCKRMEKATFSQSEVIEQSKAFITVRIDVDQQEAVAKKYNGNAKKYGGVGIPNILILSPKEEKIAHVIGFQGPEDLLNLMKRVLGH